jgi:hypothetical protein
MELGRHDATKRLVERARALLLAPGEPTPIDLAVKMGGRARLRDVVFQRL